MSDITKGAPRRGSGPSRSEHGQIIYELVQEASAEKGEWYSIGTPSGMSLESVKSRTRYAVAIVAADMAFKDGRIWVRFL